VSQTGGRKCYIEGVKRYKLSVEVGPLEDGRYLVTSPDLNGCLAEGDTVAEAIQNIEDVARVIIELCLEKHLPLPPEFLEASSDGVVKAELVVSVSP
jgi:predicted RNase H-like HicB family nuclease